MVRVLHSDVLHAERLNARQSQLSHPRKEDPVRRYRRVVPKDGELAQVGEAGCDPGHELVEYVRPGLPVPIAAHPKHDALDERDEVGACTESFIPLVRICNVILGLVPFSSTYGDDGDGAEHECLGGGPPCTAYESASVERLAFFDLRQYVLDHFKREEG